MEKDIQDRAHESQTLAPESARANLALPNDGGRRFHLWACAVIQKRQDLHGDLDRDWLHIS